MKIIDLLNKISNGELPNKTKFKVYSSCNDKDDKAFICEYDESYPGTIWCISDDSCKFNYKIDYMRILNYEVKLLEDKTIDIDSIKELKTTKVIKDLKDASYLIHRNEDKINELVQAVKHLNKEIQSIKK